MKKNLIIILVAIVVLSLGVYSATQIVSLTDDISLEKNDNCKLIDYEETVDVYGTCTNYYNEVKCDDEPENQSCVTTEKKFEYNCKTGTEVLTKSRQECVDDSLELTINENKIFNLDYGEWGKCSYEGKGNDAIITCDSKLDGNGDGICKDGESCIQFIVTKDGVERFVKNSKLEYQKEDDTFFLEKLEMMEVK